MSWEDGVSQAGHYWSTDLEEIRKVLHGRGVVPRVALSGLGAIKALSWPGGAGRTTNRGLICLHNKPREAKVCQHFCSLFAKRTGVDLEYRGQSFAGVCRGAFGAFCLPEARKRR